MKCVREDDRETQLQLYAEYGIYELPFATVRPRGEEGRRAAFPPRSEIALRGSKQAPTTGAN
jgi:hypothetical protein